MSIEGLAVEIIEVTPRLLTVMRQKVKHFAPSGLTMPQLRILSQLKPEPLGNNELAERVGVDITSMSRMADHLIRRGYLIRSPDPRDRRRVNLKLSAKGRQEQQAVFKQVKIWLAKELEKLSRAEQVRLSKGMKCMRRLEDVIRDS